MDDRVVNADPLDLGALFAEQRSALVRLARMLVDDAALAEDLVQDAFLGLHRDRDELHAASAVLAYLRTAVVNNARGVLRRRKTVRRYLSLYREPEPWPSADVDALLADEHRAVFAALRQLPAKQREVLVLRFWGGLSHAEIADTLNISVGGVKSQSSRALAKLAALLRTGED